MDFPISKLPGRLLYLGCLLAGVLQVVTHQVQAGNLLTNGDFELGSTNFSTSYIYNSPGTDSTPGTYAVETNAQTFNMLLGSFGDHTTGKGLMLLIDGSLSNNRLAWSQKVPVLTNRDYEFSGWSAAAIA